MKQLEWDKLVWIGFFWGIILCCSCGSATLVEVQEMQASPVISIPGGVLPLNFSKGQVGFDFTSSSPDSHYLLVLYSSLYETDQTIEYSLQGEEQQSVASMTNAQTIIDIDDDTDANVTSHFHQLLREREKKLSGQSPHEEILNLNKVSQELTLGSARSFKVLSSISGNMTQVTGSLRYINDNFLIYIDSRNNDSLDDADLVLLAEDYIFSIQAARDLFGGLPDVDGNGRVNILLTQGVNELSQNFNGLITGFVNAIDLYSVSDFSESNEMEVIYGLVPDPEGSFGIAISKNFSLTNILPAVLPHEYQHLANYNQHVFVQGGLPEENYLNEGISYLAQDIYNINDSHYMMQVGLENPSIVSIYLDGTASTCFTCGTTLRQRGGIYLFMRYLYEQAEVGNLSGTTSGLEFISRLLNSQLIGMSNLAHAAIGSADASQFSNLLGSFSLALYFSNKGLMNDSHYGFYGINLQSLQEDNRGTALSGPLFEAATFPFMSNLASSGIAYVSFTGADVLNAGGLLTLTMGDGFRGGGYLVTLQK